MGQEAGAGGGEGLGRLRAGRTSRRSSYRHHLRASAQCYGKDMALLCDGAAGAAPSSPQFACVL